VALTTYFEFVMSTNNPSTKSAKSVSAWLPQVAIATVGSHRYRTLTLPETNGWSIKKWLGVNTESSLGSSLNAAKMNLNMPQFDIAALQIWP